MNRDELRNVLLEKLGGKEFDTYCQWDIKKALKDVIEKYVPKSYDIVTYERQGQRVQVKYKNYAWMYIDVKKAKGDRHFNWYSGSYCDWTYKDFEVYIYDRIGTYENPVPEENRQLEEQIPVMEKLAAEEHLRKLDELHRGIEAFKLLKETFKIETDYQVRELCDYISKNFYTISDMIEDESKDK